MGCLSCLNLYVTSMTVEFSVSEREVTANIKQEIKVKFQGATDSSGPTKGSRGVAASGASVFKPAVTGDGNVSMLTAGVDICVKRHFTQNIYFILFFVRKTAMNLSAKTLGDLFIYLFIY